MPKNIPVILSLAVAVLPLQPLTAETPEEESVLKAAKLFFGDENTVTPLKSTSSVTLLTG
jgi:hypothetical protein